jgi:hypothetical protein
MSFSPTVCWVAHGVPRLAGTAQTMPDTTVAIPTARANSDLRLAPPAKRISS